MLTTACTMTTCSVPSVEVGDEGAVHLDLVEREAAQIAQRRVAGAEIVHRDADAELLQPVQGRQRLLAVVHEDPLGDLELEPVRRQAGFGEYRCDRFEQVGRRELHRREVDGDLADARATCAALRQASRQRPFAERQNEPAVLRHRDEDRRRHHALDRVTPSRQRLEAGDDVALQVDDRLIVQFQLVALDRLAQIHLDLATVVDLLVHAPVDRTDRCRGQLALTA